MCQVCKLIVISGFLIVSVIKNNASAQDDPLARDGSKGLHGVINILTFPLEWPMQSYKGCQRGVKALERNPNLSSFIGGIWGGIVPGTHKAAGRLVQGVYQLGGFGMLNPASNEGVGLPLESEYAFEFDEPLAVSYGTGFSLIGHKIARGFLNGYWGIVAEVPGKTLEGLKNHTPVRGFVNGAWYMTSRIWQGTFDIGGFLLPNYSKTTGYAFDVDTPWNKSSRSENDDDLQFSSTE